MPILAYWHIFLIVQWAKFRKLKPITSLRSVPQRTALNFEYLIILLLPAVLLPEHRRFSFLS